MIKHVFMCKLKTSGGDELNRATAAIRSLQGQIDSLVSLEVGVDEKRSPISYDVAAIACFATWDDLAHYSAHPKHREVVSLLRELCSSFAVVDYEVQTQAG